MTVKVAAAICKCTALPLSVVKADSPLFNSRNFFSLVTSYGHKNEFQLEIKVKIPTVTKAGFDIGTNMRVMYSISDAPSILAAL